MSAVIEKPRSVYAIFCEATKRIYIGVSANPEVSIKTKLRSAKGLNDYCRNHPKELSRLGVFECDFDKYGEGAFTPYLLEVNIPADKADERKWHWISEYNATDPKYGYNGRGGERVEFMLGLPENRFKKDSEA